MHIGVAVQQPPCQRRRNDNIVLYQRFKVAQTDHGTARCNGWHKTSRKHGKTLPTQRISLRLAQYLARSSMITRQHGLAATDRGGY
ncbi:hypothetical protein D3C71_1875600 [compost metagenome]